ncbi:MAG: beta-galactosidase trimerization domain-containing protein [Kiritimatiellae bacterium]|nr:beta-galactosidase trimerization domain-containing protein [Kiritimatiellia bacterium]
MRNTWHGMITRRAAAGLLLLSLCGIDQTALPANTNREAPDLSAQSFKKDISNHWKPQRWRTQKLPNGGWMITLADGTPFFPSGVDYEPLALYQPIDWASVDHDLSLIRKAGFNTIAIWCVDFHGTHADPEKKIRLSPKEMVQLAGLARKHKLYVQFHLCLDRFTHRFPRATLADGTHHHFDIDYADPDYRAFCRDYARELATALRPCTNVVTIIPWEEKIGIDAEWEGDTARVSALYASKAGKQMFEQFLLTRHGDLNTLNARWKTAYTSVRQAVDESLSDFLRGVPKTDPRQFDLLEYGELFLIDFTRRFVEVYKSIDPSMLFQCRHFDLFGPVRPLHPALSFLDTFGINNYTLGQYGPDFSFREELLRARLTAGIVGIAPCAGNYGFRAEARDAGTHGLVGSEAAKAHFAADSLMTYSLIPEMAGLSYFMVLYTGWEGDWGLVRGEQREPTPAWHAFRAAHALFALKNETIARTDYAAKPSLFIFHGLDAVFDLDQTAWIEHADLSFDLTEMNVHYQVITDTDSFDPAQRPVILAPFLAYDRKLDETLTHKLAAYVHGGGTLVIANTFGQHDRYLHPATDAERLLREMRGAEIGPRRQGDITLHGKDFSDTKLRQACYVETNPQTLDPDAEVLLTMTTEHGEQPALLRKPYGKGTLYYLLFNPLRHFPCEQPAQINRSSLPVIRFLCRELEIPTDDHFGNRGYALANGRVNIHENMLHAPRNLPAVKAGLYADEYGETGAIYSGGALTDELLVFRGRRCEERGWSIQLSKRTSLGACITEDALHFYTLDAVDARIQKADWKVRIRTEPTRVYSIPKP